MEVYLLEKERGTDHYEFCACYADLNKAIEEGRKLAQAEAQKHGLNLEQIHEIEKGGLNLFYWECCGRMFRLRAIPVT